QIIVKKVDKVCKPTADRNFVVFNPVHNIEPVRL
ncbi:MAG: hypothetical protein ACI9V8_001503, partial [Urechidicola sp.]